MRLKIELLEAIQRKVGQSQSEPLLDLIHGYHGTGKSKVIEWMRKFMEVGLGWQHGLKFVCLAFPNSMAARIQGHTVHHWSGIPARNTEGNATGDRHKQSMKCQALRVIIIYEAGMLSAELLDALDYLVAQAICVHGSLKKDQTISHGSLEE